MQTKSTDWAVYCLETDQVLGVWHTYYAANQFWNDTIQGHGTNCAVFPADECDLTAFLEVN